MSGYSSHVQEGSAAQVTRPSGLKHTFANIPGADYVRDVLALVLLLASFKLPLTAVSSQTVPANSQALYVLMTVLAGLALTLPYLTRFGIMPKGWKVSSTRSLRLVLSVPYLGYFLWLLVGPHIFEVSNLGVGTAFAVGGAGVALAAQARQSELGPESQDRAAGSTAALCATLIASAMAIAYVASLVVTIIKANEATNFPYIAVVFALASTAFFILLPALAVALKKTAGWRSFVIGLGITLVVIFYFGATSAGGLPMVESFTAITTPAAGLALFLPLTFTLGVGSFLLPVLAATVSAPAFKRITVRNSPLEQRLDLAAITLRMSAILGGVLVLVSAIYLITFKDAAVYVQPGVGRANGQAITILVLGLIIVAVCLGALKAFNANPAGSRITIAIALAVVALSGLIILSSAPVLGEKILVAGHLILALGLPAIGAYALIGNKPTREFFANFAANRPAPSTQAYEWSGNTPIQANSAPYHPTQTGPVNIGTQSQQGRPQQPHFTPGGSPTGSQQAYQPNSGYEPQTVSQAPPVVKQQPVVGPEPVSSQEPVVDPEPQVNPEPVRADARQNSEQTHSDDTATQTVSRAAVADMVDQANGSDQHTQVISEQPLPSHGYTREVAVDPKTPAVVLAKIAEVAPELRPALAQNPSTYDALLGWLAQIGDPEIDAALKRRNG